LKTGQSLKPEYGSDERVKVLETATGKLVSGQKLPEQTRHVQEAKAEPGHAGRVQKGGRKIEGAVRKGGTGSSRRSKRYGWESIPGGQNCNLTRRIYVEPGTKIAS